VNSEDDKREISLDEKFGFLAKLELKSIQRKVDLLVISPETKFKDVYKKVLKTGVRIL
jgi:hypothetical protein